VNINIPLQPKQELALNKSFDTGVLFYGGAKGGGKSYLVRAREVIRRLQYPNSKGLIVRKTYPELRANHIIPFFKEYPVIREWFNKADKIIYWPNGSTTEFSYLQTTDDVYTYQGREYDDISIDEITQHEEEVFKILRTSNRTTNPKIKPTMMLTGNPGGPGHAWVKRIFIDRMFQDNERPEDFDFVQASVYDNLALLSADPGYIQRLMDLPEAKRRAYLEGDWDVFEGAVFHEFRRSKHTIEPFVPSDEFPHFLGVDWGYVGKKTDQGAFSAHAMALVEETDSRGDKFSRLIIYKEWYGKEKTPEEWAKIIKMSAPVKFNAGVADASMFNRNSDGSISISQRMEKTWNKKRHWLTLKPGTRNRLSRVAATHDWLKIAPDDMPYMMFTENCKHLTRTLPLLIYDTNKTKLEDVDTTLEDHLWDSASYAWTNIRAIPKKLGAISNKQQRPKALPELLMELDPREWVA